MNLYSYGFVQRVCFSFGIYIYIYTHKFLVVTYKSERKYEIEISSGLFDLCFIWQLFESLRFNVQCLDN